jgi:hypothetical protein
MPFVMRTIDLALEPLVPAAATVRLASARIDTVEDTAAPRA